MMHKLTEWKRKRLTAHPGKHQGSARVQDGTTQGSLGQVEEEQTGGESGTETVGNLKEKKKTSGNGRTDLPCKCLYFHFLKMAEKLSKVSKLISLFVQKIISGWSCKIRELSF